MRYLAQREVEHGCCYEAMVVDTIRLTRYGHLPELVCECPDMETAERIALALNKLEPA